MKIRIIITYFSVIPKRILDLTLFFCLLLLSCSAFSQAQQNYHVSPTGSNSYEGTFDRPLQTIEEAVKRVKPGGTVFLLNGTYRTDNYKPVMDINIAGTSGKYITFKSYPGHSPIVSGGEEAFNATVIDGSYIIIEGLEFIGDNHKLDLAGATKAFEDTRDKIAPAKGKYNTNAISIGKESTAHHIIIRNCKVHDFPAGGIGVGSADYITIENNMVYNNSWYTMYATSGISILGPKPIDIETSYKLFVRGNICYNNKTQVPWLSDNSIKTGIYKLSDGNGIIIDVNNGDQETPVYTGRTLVENNISYNNGGSGIHSFHANHVDIINNTAYHNGNVVGYPEIFGSDAADVKIYNNIMYARSGGDCNSDDDTAIYNYNLYFNGRAFRKGNADLIGNPEFIKLAFDGTADFSLKNNSPAINSGNTTSGQHSVKDILGIERTSAGRSDRGAYEFQGTPAAGITITPAIQNLYQDALDIEWSSEVSFGGTHNLAYGDNTKEGSRSIQFNYTNPYGALSLARTDVLPTANVASFKFWVYSTTARKMKFKTQSDYTTGPSTEISFSTEANTWKEITISLAQLGNPTLIKRIFFSADNFTGEVLFDNIRFIPLSSSIGAETTLSVADLEPLSQEDDNILVFPNPANDVLEIQLNSSIEEHASIELVSASSQIVHKSYYKKDTSSKIDVNNLATGIYFLRVSDGIQTIAKKIMIR
ncbi:T9SS type A sorting domain-containing protein [Flavobacterium psychroterrae]|uniref:T9SS type A sorting domain-containing protein n=1 Tax=Flavobacterium psychroterrae TaxID=2133767 RepID=A0ABS5PHS2_9FLAO|nr:T9SS type A sorting domain-containing protein [Flavobacterium psychroterrae]MBS7233786.1 T9SS type A sorting domain-containing protein [Flavobacterium psychroterrae]